MGTKPKNVMRTKLDRGWVDMKVPPRITLGPAMVEERYAKMQRKLAVAEALAAERQRTAADQLKANQAIAVNALQVADRVVNVRDRLAACETALEDARHELEKAQALAAGFRTRAEKAEASLAEMTSARDGLRSEIGRLEALVEGRS